MLSGLSKSVVLSTFPNPTIALVTVPVGNVTVPVNVGLSRGAINHNAVVLAVCKVVSATVFAYGDKSGSVCC